MHHKCKIAQIPPNIHQGYASLLSNSRMDSYCQSRLELALLEANLDKIDWEMLSSNPAIFTYDYEQMYKNKQALHRQLITKTHYLDRKFIPEIAQMIARYMH